MRNNFGKINILVVIIIVLVQLILCAAVGVYFFFLSGNGEEQPQKLSTLPPADVNPPRNQSADRDGRTFSSGAGYGAKDYTRDYAIFSLGDIVVNPTGTDRFFLTTVLLEYRLADRRLPAELQNKTPMMKDRVVGYFSRLTIDDLRDIENRDIFRDDIMRVVNNLLVEGRITDVFFEQFLIQ